MLFCCTCDKLCRGPGTCLYLPWAPAPAAQGYTHVHVRLRLTSCCAIPGVWHSEGMTHTLTNHLTLFSYAIPSYMVPKTSSHLSLSSSFSSSTLSYFIKLLALIVAVHNKLGSRRAAQTCILKVVYDWSSLMRARRFSAKYAGPTGFLC